MTQEWNGIFHDWLASFNEAYNRWGGFKADNDRWSGSSNRSPDAWISRVMNDIEYKDDDDWKISVKGFKEFLKDFKDCPYNARSFCERYGYEYRAVWVNGRAVRGIKGKKGEELNPDEERDEHSEQTNFQT